MASASANTPLFPTSGAAFTKSDTAQFPPSAVYVGNGGNVVVRPADGGAPITFVGIPNGSMVPIMVVGVMDTNTTASDFVRVF